MSSTRRVDALTGARALAGVYILVLHFGAPLFTRAPAWLETLRAAGFVATSFFLFLSGFVLTLVYAPRLADARLDRRSFFAQRVARLYPAYALALVMMLPLALVRAWGDASAAFGAASPKAKLATGLAHALMIHAWVPRLVTSWNVPDWCVSVELFFYVTFPLLATLLLRRSPKQLVTIALAAWMTSLALSIGYTLVRPDGFAAGASSTGFYINVYKFCPLVRWPEFVAGVAMGALYQRLPVERRLGQHATPLLAGTLAVAAAVLLASRHIAYTLLHDGLLVPVYAAIVWTLTAGRGPLHRALAWRPLVTLGNAGFALYVLQAPVMMWLVILTGRDHPETQSVPFTIGYLALMLAVAVVAQRHVEQPVQAWLRGKLERPTTPPLHAPVGAAVA